LKPESYLSSGKAERLAGRYAAAITLFRAAARWRRHAPIAVQLEYAALREVDISRYLIDRFIRRIGWTRDQYLGFGAIDPPLDEKNVADRLAQLCMGIPAAVSLPTGPHSERFVDLIARDLDQTGSWPLPPVKTADLNAALVSQLWKRGRFDQALQMLQDISASTIPSVQVQHLLGMALWRSGDTEGALRAFNLSLLYLTGPTGLDGTQLRILYKGYRISYYDGEFLATPESVAMVTEFAFQNEKSRTYFFLRRLARFLRQISPKLRWRRKQRRQISRPRPRGRGLDLILNSLGHYLGHYRRVIRLARRHYYRALRRHLRRALPPTWAERVERAFWAIDDIERRTRRAAATFVKPPSLWALGHGRRLVGLVVRPFRLLRLRTVAKIFPFPVKRLMGGFLAHLYPHFRAPDLMMVIQAIDEQRSQEAAADESHA